MSCEQLGSLGPGWSELAGPLASGLCCCWVWFRLADLLLPSLPFAAVDTAKNGLMILAFPQEAAVSSVTWPPSRSYFAAGSSCLLLKTDLEGDLRELLCQHCPRPGLPVALTYTNRSPCAAIFMWGASGVLCWGGAAARLPLPAHPLLPLRNVPRRCSPQALVSCPRTASHRLAAWRPSC